MMNVDTVLIGATFYAVGYATASDKECLIIDKRSVVGADFAACLNAKPIGKIRGDFAAMLESKGILSKSGQVHIVPCAPELGRFILKNDLNVLLETEVIEIAPTDGDYEITVFNRNGMTKIRAESVINTESIEAPGSYRTLGAMLVNGSRPITVPQELGYVQYERNEGEPIFHLRIDNNCDMLGAREKMRRLIDEGKHFGDWQIGAIASELAWHYGGAVRLTLPDGTRDVPSASFGDIISAMEGGISDATANYRGQKDLLTRDECEL